MNRATRDRMTSGTGTDYTVGRACWETPPAVYDKLNADYGPFDVDLTADATRNLSPVWFGPGSPFAADAITAPWTHFGTRGYSNPPYGRFVPPMLAKAVYEQALGFTSVLLLALRVTGAFRRHILRGASELLFCDKRICFYEKGQPRWNLRELQKTGRYIPDPAIFDSIVVIYRPGWALPRPRVGEWAVPPHAWPLRGMTWIGGGRDARTR